MIKLPFSLGQLVMSTLLPKHLVMSTGAAELARLARIATNA